eukprot:2191103-Amphidinium_carterae.1
MESARVECITSAYKGLFLSESPRHCAYKGQKRTATAKGVATPWRSDDTSLPQLCRCTHATR